MLGYGVASVDERKKWNYLLLAILAGIPIAALGVCLRYLENPIISYVSILVPLYGLLLYYYVAAKLLPLGRSRKTLKHPIFL
jgi:hypothetical protein